MARSETVRRFGEDAYTDGYTVTLTVDGRKQQVATEALRDGLEAMTGGTASVVYQETLATSELSDLILNYPRVESLLPAIVKEVNDEVGVSVHVRRIGPGIMPFESMTWASIKPKPDRAGTGETRRSFRGDVVYVRAQTRKIDPENETNSTETLNDEAARPNSDRCTAQIPRPRAPRSHLRPNRCH